VLHIVRLKKKTKRRVVMMKSSCGEKKERIGAKRRTPRITTNIPRISGNMEDNRENGDLGGDECDGGILDLLLAGRYRVLNPVIFDTTLFLL